MSFYTELEQECINEGIAVIKQAGDTVAINDKHLKNRWQGVEDEYDIVLYNHASVAIIEVKYKAHINNISDVLKKAETFRILFPQYKDFKIYLGLASMSFYPELEQECINEGIAVIKQVGDTVVINDEHLKTF
jgi:signal peptidase I